MFEHLDPACDCSGRICRNCQQTKCHKAFHRDIRDNSGLRTICKECVREYQKANIDRINETRRKTRHEYADHYNAYNREYHRKNPEPKKARDRRYRQENAETFRASMRMWRERNAEKLKGSRNEYNRQYRKEHPEITAAHLANRQARKRQVGGSFSPKEWKALCTHYDFSCLCCGKREPEIKLTADHVVPLARGGTNSIDNIQPLCLGCNMSKSTKTIDYRVRWQK